MPKHDKWLINIIQPNGQYYQSVEVSSDFAKAVDSYISSLFINNNKLDN